jgi:hypothetical protein
MNMVPRPGGRPTRWTLTVDVAHPRTSLTVTVTSPGRHSYTLSSLTICGRQIDMVQRCFFADIA